MDSLEYGTYAELNERANRVANWMGILGVQKGDRVSILAQNSVAYVDLFYGLAKIGAILALLNWRLTARELFYIVNDKAQRDLAWAERLVNRIEQTLQEMEAL